MQTTARIRDTVDRMNAFSRVRLRDSHCSHHRTDASRYSSATSDMGHSRPIQPRPNVIPLPHYSKTRRQVGPGRWQRCAIKDIESLALGLRTAAT